MVKTVTKKVLSLFLTLLICVSLVPEMSVTVFAADGIEMRLEKLKEEYPDGKYWNHYVGSSSATITNILETRNESYADTVTSSPCSTHNEGGSGVGGYDCNYFDQGYQCHGFAARLFYKLFGVRQSSLQEVERKRYEIQPGDLVRLKNNTHSGIVLSVSGLRFTIAECNVAQSGGKPCCQISWGRSCLITDITYFVHAPNYDKVKNDTSWKNFETKQNLGSSFYGAIVNTKSNKALTVDSTGSNVVLKTFNGTADQMWKFTALSGNSYKIISCFNGKALDAGKLSSNSPPDIAVSAYSDISKQKWGFYGSGSSLYVSPEVTDSVLCVENGVYNDGTKIQIRTKADNSAQIFKVVKKTAPSASTITATGNVGSATLSWTKSANTSSYKLEIYRDGKLTKTYNKLTSNSGKVSLSAGNYSAKIYSNNSFTSVAGNTAYFTVSAKGVLGKTAKITASPSANSIKLTWTAVPGATGYRVYVKNGSSWKKITDTTKTTATVSSLSRGAFYTFAVKAYSKSGTKVTWASAYTTLKTATTPAAPSKITVSQSTSAIKLSWPAVKNASGYIIYYKTSSGWKENSTVTGTSKTISGLSSAKTYTFAVKPYIKTDSGKIKGDYRSITTATKPAAPKLSYDPIRNVSTRVTWKAVEGVDGYRVYYKLDNTSYELLHDFDSDKRGIAVSGMTYNTYYTFAVRSYVNVGSKRVYSSLSTVRFRAVYL